MEIQETIANTEFYKKEEKIVVLYLTHSCPARPSSKTESWWAR